MGRNGRAFAAASIVAALAAVGASPATARTLSAKQARTVASKETRALYRQYVRDGEDAVGYGVESCRRLSRRDFNCTAYIDFTDMTCTLEWAVGYTRRSQRSPAAAYVDDSADCFRR